VRLQPGDLPRQRSQQWVALTIKNAYDLGREPACRSPVHHHEAQGSVEPKEILQTGRRILDFARYDVRGVNADLASTKWGDNKHWWFSSLPEPIGFMYHPVATGAALEDQRFVVTVRIIRAEPANSTDRQFAIGVHGFDLICEPL
jgi:hypothetical protein